MEQSASADNLLWQEILSSTKSQMERMSDLFKIYAEEFEGLVRLWFMIPN